MTGDPEKITKLAVGYTNISGVDIPVDLPGDFIVRNLFLAQFIRNKHDFGKRGLFKYKHSFFNREKIEIQCFCIELVQIHNE
jgi:hypothetical protein